MFCYTEPHLETSHTSTMELFAKIVKGFYSYFASNIERVNSLRSPLKSTEKTIGYFEENFILRVYGQE